MGKSRNQRSKNESSFLQHVKDVLTRLHEEMVLIKVNIEELKQHSLNHRANDNVTLQSSSYMNGLVKDDLNYWSDGSLWWPEGTEASFKTWNLLAPEFSPSGPSVFERSTLMGYRHVAVNQSQTAFMKILTKAMVLSDSPETSRHTLPGKVQLPEGILEQHFHDAARCMQRHVRGYQAREKTRCAICRERMGHCVCEDILCWSCLKTADVCRCPSPLLRQQLCTICGAQRERPSLHGARFIELPLPTSECHECGGLETSIGDWSWIYPSDHACSICLRRDCQQTIQSCDGEGCDSLCHVTCMTRYASELYLCSTCVANNVLPEIEAEDCSEFSDNDMGIDSNEQQPSSEYRVWGDKEVLLWMEVTLRMASELRTKDELQDLLTQRWRTAACHIPVDKHQRMKAMIEDKFDVSLSA